MPHLEDFDAYKRASTNDILEKAKEVVDAQVKRTTLFAPGTTSHEDTIPKFQLSELRLGRVIGRGGFCIVHELNNIRLEKVPGDNTASSSASEAEQVNHSTGLFNMKLHNSQSGNESTNTEISSREYLARRVYSKKGGKFVVKRVNPEWLENDRSTYLRGIIDLALETKFLGAFQHPNILTLQAISSDRISFQRTDFFIILDRLQETLPKKLCAWAQTSRSTKGVTGFITSSRKKTTSLLTDRLLVAHDIADAMDFLHSKRIVYRDLKPDNCGFDVNGITKLFDFGIAKELCDSEKVDNGLYKMTGMCGAIRYMAPEVGLRKPYNLLADVYSYAMLLWYIIALEPPLASYMPKMFVDRVFRKGYRPATKDKWSPRLTAIMKTGWSESIFDRPSFRDIMVELHDEVESIDPQIASLMERHR